LATEVTGSYYAVARGNDFGSFGIYADVKKFLMEVDGVVGALKFVNPIPKLAFTWKNILRKRKMTPIMNHVPLQQQMWQAGGMD
jgi:hypothetical protein